MIFTCGEICSVPSGVISQIYRSRYAILFRVHYFNLDFWVMVTQNVAQYIYNFLPISLHICVGWKIRTII